MVTWQDPVPVHAPDQPTNTESGCGVAESCRGVPTRDRLAQVCAAPGVFARVALGDGRTESARLLTLPAPLSKLSTVTERVWGPRNCAVTLLATSIVTSHPPVPVQAPDQPVNTESGRAPAERWTSV